MVHFRSSSRAVPATSYDDFSMTLTTTTHSPQQLMAVWNRLLPDDPEGPTLISYTALRSRTLCFYTRTPLSHSGHTAGQERFGVPASAGHLHLSLIHISEPTRRTPISYAVFCLK